jgi:hypothetical protein
LRAFSHVEARNASAIMRQHNQHVQRAKVAADPIRKFFYLHQQRGAFSIRAIPFTTSDSTAIGIRAMTTINLTIFAQTDIGKQRGVNEDNFLILDLSAGKYWVAHEQGPQDVLTYVQGYYGLLLAVADGVGGVVG